MGCARNEEVGLAGHTWVAVGQRAVDPGLKQPEALKALKDLGFYSEAVRDMQGIRRV